VKKFIAWVSGMNQLQQTIWQEAGFDIVVHECGQTEGSSIQNADILWLYATSGMIIQPTIDLEVQLKKSYPKVFFLCKRDASIMPCHWSEYQQHIVFVDGIEYLIGSKLEEPLPTALLEYFAQQRTAELAAVLYIVILESVFRETAEWCGHMSSVVGRM